MGLPNTLRALGAQLLDHCSELLASGVTTLRAMVAGCTEQRMKAVRAVAAQKIVDFIDRTKTTLPPLRPAFLRARPELGEALDAFLLLLDECTARVVPHLPQTREDSDDEYY